MSALRILTIVGARPQFIKAAAFSRAVANDARVEESLLHSGQHFDSNMSKIFFSELGIPEPRYNLNIHGGSHGAMTGRMLESIEQVLLTDRPNAVLVYGDTNTTIAGALAAAKLKLPIVHVEAGLRSYNRAMPEEINRVLTDHISDLLLCPTVRSVDNLRIEGITRGVHHVGDVMHDATLHAREVAMERSSILDDLCLANGGYHLCTIHRAENTDEPDQLAHVLRFVGDQAGSLPVVFPVHPRTRRLITDRGHNIGALRLIDPLGYIDMHRLLAGARTVLTDSGGLQKEAYFHRVPCVTMRSETEWVETIDAGWNRLWSAAEYNAPRREISDYGDGQASQAILNILKSAL